MCIIVCVCVHCVGVDCYNFLIIQVGVDFLEESITAFEDCVQSVDIAAFNKI